MKIEKRDESIHTAGERRMVYSVVHLKLFGELEALSLLLPV
jgi:hypothetical protein